MDILEIAEKLDLSDEPSVYLKDEEEFVISPFKNVLRNIRMKTEIDVTMFGAKGDGTADDTKAIQDAIDYAYDNGFSTIFVPKGTYIVKKPLYLYEKLALVGDSQYTSIIKKTNNAKDIYGKNSTIVFINYGQTATDNTDTGYQQIKRLHIEGAPYNYTAGRADLDKYTAIYSQVNSPYVIIEEVETSHVDVAIELKGAWISRFIKLKLRGHYSGIIISNECQGVVIQGVNILQTHEYGLFLNGSHYNSISSVFVEWCYGGTAFYFGYGTYNINGLGVELTQDLNNCVTVFHSNVILNEALIPRGQKDNYEAFCCNNGILKVSMAWLGFSNSDDGFPTDTGKLCNLTNYSKLILEYCTTVNEYPIESVIDETSNITVV